MKKLLVLAGPTASGKTALAIEWARLHDAPILSVDSRQIYRGLAIGTAQPTATELAAARHHLIAELPIDAPFNAGIFERMALERLDELFARHDTVIAVGGSGLYLKVLCEGMDPLPEADPALRATIGQTPLPELLDQLALLDPVYFSQVDRQNPARVRRAVEVCLQTGQPYSSLRTAARVSRPFAIEKFALNRPRPELYARIDARVLQMMADGLETEARAVYRSDWRDINALNTVGYKELFGYFEGASTRDQAVEQIQRNTRHYAKRQLTWLAHDAGWTWINP